MVRMQGAHPLPTHAISTLDQPTSPPLPEYPRPQLTRSDWMNLNGVWQFQGESRPGPPPVARSLPGRIVVPFSPEGALSGVGRHYDYMWYRRLFSVPPGWLSPPGCRGAACKRVVLHFGAVNYAAQVYVNGQLVQVHAGGYDGFDVDITRQLRRRGQQELLVGVSNLVQRSRADQVVGKQRVGRSSPIYLDPSSGIWQTVWLEPVPAAHIARLVLTPDLVHGALQITAYTTGSGRQRITAIAYDGWRPAARISGAPYTQLSMQIPFARLWSPSHPFLYTLTVSLTVNGRQVDDVGSYFGLRSISVGSYAGAPHILLNGHFVFELGTLDQGYWPQSGYTAPSDAALQADLTGIKALGFNTVREHMKIEPDRFYYWADRLGLLVWQDMPAMSRVPTSAADQHQFEGELRAMVLGLQDHPSIVIWTPFNEDWGQFDASRIAAEVKLLDPSRLVDPDSGGGCCTQVPAGDLFDRHGYPGPRRFTPPDARATVDGEFGGLGLFQLGHTWLDSGWAYQQEHDAGGLTEDYVSLLSRVRDLEIGCGLSGAIYTQLYDSERELDGLETFDRQILKVDSQQVREANQAVLDAASEVSTPPSGGC